MTNTLQKIMHNGNQYLLGGGTTVQSITVKLESADWSNNEQTVTATGVTASNTVIVSPAPASFTDYGTAQIYASVQASDSLTFTCGTVPANDITVNVVILN